MADQERPGGGLPQYYQQLDHIEILRSFKNFDDAGDFKSLDDKVRQSSSRNFVIDFGDDEAWCGFDLEADAVGKLLKAPRPSALNTRWINIWLPYEQDDLLKELAKHLDFSPRLLGFMQSKPMKNNSKSQHTKSSMFDRLRHPRHPPPYSKSVSNPSVDVEDYIGMVDIKPTPDFDMTTVMNQYSLASEVYHWSSVDWGRRFICLGYNSLYPIARTQSTPPESDDSDFEEDYHPMDHDLPEGKRIWSWLILCEDKTVITISEDPFPYRSSEDLDSSERKALLIIRRNLINVFRNCSKAYDSSKISPIMKLPIRERIGDSQEETAHRTSDIPGLLFYCLFDDWYGSYSVVFRREHRYGAELDKLRKDMMRRAELEHINRLHHIGRQLAVLKRMYQSYDLMIDRVLEKQEASLASLKNSQIISGVNSGVESMMSSIPQVAESQSLLGVALSSAARVRFERLRHRIRLYAISEIQECLDQKESLVMMNFNLIAIKESLSVERLTRVTLLLAKVTILFMPVSLMTAYFSCQLVDVKFTSNVYWTCFGIIFGVSLVGLLGFSVMSGTLEGSMIYKPMSRRFVEWFGSKKRRRRMREKDRRGKVR